MAADPDAARQLEKPMVQRLLNLAEYYKAIGTSEGPEARQPGPLAIRPRPHRHRHEHGHHLAAVLDSATLQLSPLLFHGLKPTTAGQYAWACIAFALLAVLTRARVNLKTVLERSVWIPPRLDAEQPLLREHEKAAAKAENPPVSGTRPVGLCGVRGELWRTWSAWRSTLLLQRLGTTSYEILLVGFGYILMLAVMTMNVGYFLSVLGGIYVGTFVLGAATAAADNTLQHC
ncbi:Ctr copper transporter family-domain-containing protein [Lasiosphaeris hirsuta]|uniref:Copper transport protein n=1 Tax=Lasiosphaeris hirsuta TaxID=260670 RepID=A0AA40E213_9PEZI|nr:Ctr copper transporter family-domain-containing protein [Lasiosphaeris hirsuta]